MGVLARLELTAPSTLLPVPTLKARKTASAHCWPWMMDETKKDNCVADFERGCVHVDGSDCCNDDSMCINGVCRNWVPILESTPLSRPTQRTTGRGMGGEGECRSNADCPKRAICRKRPGQETGYCRLLGSEEGEACKTKADCPGRAICEAGLGQESGHCRPLIFEDLAAKSREVGCPKCKTVADCPKYAHCGLNGCCQFW